MHQVLQLLESEQASTFTVKLDVLKACVTNSGLYNCESFNEAVFDFSLSPDPDCINLKLVGWSEK